MAAIRVPRRYQHDEWETRQPRGSNPRGPPRGGPERSADDPRRTPRGGLCGGPERSAKEPQTPSQTSHGKSNGGNAGKPKGKDERRPTIITVEENGHERSWGQLSEINAWRAGFFWLEMGKKVTVLLEKDGKRKEVDVLKRLERGRDKVWLVEKKSQPQQEKGRGDDERTRGDEDTTTLEEDGATVVEDDEPTVEENNGMQQDTAEEIETMNKMWLMEKVKELEKENGEMKAKIQELEVKIAQQAEATSGVVAFHPAIQSAITEIAEHIRQQIMFNESTRTSIAGIVQEVEKHQDYFREVVRVLQNHEQHIANQGLARQEMAQYLNVLIQENEKTKAWVGSLMRETQAQEQVLRQHEMRQHVLAEVIKRMVDRREHQQARPQCQVGAGPTVTEVDDDDPDRLDFTVCPNPHKGPPNGGTGQATSKPPRTRKPKTIAKRK